MTYVRASSQLSKSSFSIIYDCSAALDDVPQLLSNEHPVIEETLKPPARIGASVRIGSISPPRWVWTGAWNDGNVSVTIMLTVREFLERDGSSPFAKWFAGLDATAAAKITTAVRRLELGNFSNVKGVGAGVFEYKIDFGPGYRVYFGKDGDTLVILLVGGTKKTQDSDIATAHGRWQDYKKRKAKEK